MTVTGYAGCINCDILVNFHSKSNSMTICSGEDSCKQARITNSKTILCNGLNSCGLAEMENVTQLYMLGRESGVDSIIISPANDNSVEFYFYGLKSGLNATIVCNENSSCYIYSSDTATNINYNTNLICYGTCNIDCYASNAADCFNIQLTNDTLSQVRYITDNPTSAPTGSPTVHPTNEPTAAPVVAYAIVGKLECIVDTNDITSDDGCSLNTDDKLEKCCQFENRYETTAIPALCFCVCF